MKKFKISPLSVIFLPIAFAICGARSSAIMLIAVFIHECGHIIAIMLSGQKISYVTLLPCGLDITREDRGSYLTDAAIYIAGPAFNFVFAIIFLFFCPSLLTANLAFGIFNLLPLMPLDGGCALRALILNYSTLDTAYTVMKVLSAITLLITYIVAIVTLLYSEWNISLLLVCIMLFTINFFDKKS